MSSEGTGLLGHYENFPAVIHGVSRFTYGCTEKELKQAVLRVIHRLNQEKRDLKAVSLFSTSKCVVSFEFGVAEDSTFNYLDEEELNRFRKELARAREKLSTLDFFCVIRYHVLKEGKRVPLKFDYNLLRFVFKGNEVEIQIFHERGIRRVPPEDFANFIIEQIGKEIHQKK